ncbi:MAG: hypothetical protein M3N57_07265 [Actinomycetota bacterium]|nr:hypothetical protein [Actinomycetota bacterium]
MERIGVPALVAAEVAAVAGLHRLGHLPWLAIKWGDLPMWLDTVRPEDAVAATARVVALACAYWLLATTLAYVATRRSRSTAARLTRRLTPAAVRRLADRAVVFSLAGALSGVPAAAGAANDPPPPPFVVLDDGRLVVTPPGPPPPSAVPPGPDVAPPPDAPPAATDDDAAAADVPVLPAPPEVTSEGHEQTATRRSTVYTVRSADNLWSISGRTLAAARGRPVRQLSDPEVARYWVRVIDANRATLRSGDPDLIYPGEQVVLPSPDEHPR